MMAYQSDASMPRGAQARYAPRRGDLDTSMLQYSERMRTITTSRVSLGQGFLGGGRASPSYTDVGAGVSRLNGAFLERRSLQRPYGKPSNGFGDKQQDDSLPHLNNANSRPRRQRPMSFDEKELQQNITAVKTRRRPLSLDDKELERNKQINAQHVARQRREAFSKPERPVVIPSSGVDENSRVSPEGAEVRISFVDASDLCELVDINRRMKRNQNAGSSVGTAKLVNVSDAIEFVENIGTSKAAPRQKRDSLPNQRSPVLTNCESPPPNDRNVKINVNLNTDLLTRKRHSSSVKSDSTASRNRLSPQGDRLTPIGMFLQQAVSDFAGQNALTTRPRRAKRMSLRKPRLLDIPEDTDNTQQREDRVPSVKHRLPAPTDSSLQAIKEVRDPRREDMLSDDPRLEPDARMTPQRPVYNEFIVADSPLPSGKPHSRKVHKGKQTPKRSGPDLDIDKLLMTSIYPPVLWDDGAGPEQYSSKHFVLPEKSSYKEKAQKKMKKLIFLRDRPEQHYRRDP